MKAKQRILVVEDSEPLRKILAERLNDASYTVLEAKSGEEGLRVAQAEKPDMIITDIVMYPMDGLELAKRVRESGEWGESVRIVALTNQSKNEENDRVLPLKLDAYMVKADTPLEKIANLVNDIFKSKHKV